MSTSYNSQIIRYYAYPSADVRGAPVHRMHGLVHDKRPSQHLHEVQHFRFNLRVLVYCHVET